MLTAEPHLVSAASLPQSRGHAPSYSDLAIKANSLRLGLETLALVVPSNSERRYLRLLADTAARLHQLLKPARAGVR